MRFSIDKAPTAPAERYDWGLFRDAALQHPGVWICEDGDDRPSTTAHQMRRGTPSALLVCGAFDAVVRKHEGTFLRYVGIPVAPVAPWEMSSDDFTKTLERTFDPDLFPAGTPDLFYAFAERDTPKHLKRLGAHTLPTLDRHLAEREAKRAAKSAPEAPGMPEESAS